MSFYPDVPYVHMDLMPGTFYLSSSGAMCSLQQPHGRVRHAWRDRRCKVCGLRQLRKTRLYRLAVRGMAYTALFDYTQIYPGSKVAHFQQLAQETGVDYADMCTYAVLIRECFLTMNIGTVCAMANESGRTKETGRALCPSRPPGAHPSDVGARPPSMAQAPQMLNHPFFFEEPP